jgi:hypothetical protein
MEFILNILRFFIFILRRALLAYDRHCEKKKKSLYFGIFGVVKACSKLNNYFFLEALFFYETPINREYFRDALYSFKKTRIF